jgi:hypothetical protein
MGFKGESIRRRGLFNLIIHTNIKNYVVEAQIKKNIYDNRRQVLPVKFPETNAREASLSSSRMRK